MISDIKRRAKELLTSNPNQYVSIILIALGFFITIDCVTFIINFIFFALFGASSLAFALSPHFSVSKIIASVGSMAIILLLLMLFENGVRDTVSDWISFKMILLDRNYYHFNLLSNIPLVFHLIWLSIVTNIIKGVVPFAWLLIELFVGPSILISIGSILISLLTLIIALSLSQASNIYIDDTLNNKYVTAFSAISRSIKSMKGLKSKLFLLDFSFILWYLLIIILGLGFLFLPLVLAILLLLITLAVLLFVVSYQRQSEAVFYNKLISNNNSSYISSSRLYTYQPMNNQYNQYNTNPDQSYNPNDTYY